MTKQIWNGFLNKRNNLLDLGKYKNWYRMGCSSKRTQKKRT